MKKELLSKLIVSCLIIIGFIQSSQAQTSQNELGNWMMYFGLNRVNDKLSIHTEVQYRNHKVGPSIEQLLLRTGMNYHFADNAFATAGYGYIATHEFESEQSEPETTEHRIWQQLITTNFIGKFKLEHRYRVEQRWVNDDYRNRLRYRLMLFYPINKPKIEEGVWFLGIYDEIFLNTEKVFFDRNRLYGALGYQLNENTGLQIGMLHQRVNNFGKWHLQFALLYNLDFRKNE